MPRIERAAKPPSPEAQQKLTFDPFARHFKPSFVCNTHGLRALTTEKIILGTIVLCARTMGQGNDSPSAVAFLRKHVSGLPDDDGNIRFVFSAVMKGDFFENLPAYIQESADLSEQEKQYLAQALLYAKSVAKTKAENKVKKSTSLQAPASSGSFLNNFSTWAKTDDVPTLNKKLATLVAQYGGVSPRLVDYLRSDGLEGVTVAQIQGYIRKKSLTISVFVEEWGGEEVFRLFQERNRRISTK